MTLETENKEAVEKLFKLINLMGNEKDLANTFSEILRKEHRTLQQSMMGLFKLVIEEYAKDINMDLRNEASKAWAEKVVRHTEYPGRFPFF